MDPDFHRQSEQIVGQLSAHKDTGQPGAVIAAIEFAAQDGVELGFCGASIGQASRARAAVVGKEVVLILAPSLGSAPAARFVAVGELGAGRRRIRHHGTVANSVVVAVIGQVQGEVMPVPGRIAKRDAGAPAARSV